MELVKLKHEEIIKFTGCRILCESTRHVPCSLPSGHCHCGGVFSILKETKDNQILYLKLYLTLVFKKSTKDQILVELGKFACGLGNK